MKFILPILVLTILISCGQVETKKESKETSESNSLIDVSSDTQKDTTIQILWRDMKYDASLKDTFNSIFINQDYIKLMTEPEKAALAYIATFIGSECWWDGDSNEDRSNLDCKMISALGLGYQCSDQHLGFLRKWFSTEQGILSELEKSNCPTTPYTATNQNTFDEIKLTLKDDSIIVFFKASGVNMREQSNWNWSETAYFKLLANDLKLIEKVKSEVLREKFEM